MQDSYKNKEIKVTLYPRSEGECFRHEGGKYEWVSDFSSKLLTGSVGDNDAERDEEDWKLWHALTYVR